jgi:hypothetical protein
MAENRTPRELDSRIKMERPKKWVRAGLLPEPKPEPGYVFRWIRVATQGQDDPTNVSSALQEGWEPVKASEHPEVQLMRIDSSKSRFPDSIEIGGLLLCKTPAEFAEQRSDFFNQQAAQQMQSVDNNFMRENDPRMPLFRERKSEVKFGRGS